jgi:hypothetical protein
VQAKSFFSNKSGKFPFTLFRLSGKMPIIDSNNRMMHLLENLNKKKAGQFYERKNDNNYNQRFNGNDHVGPWQR